MESIQDNIILFRWLESIGAQSRGLVGSLELSDPVAESVADDYCMTDGSMSGRPYISVRERLLALGATIKAVDGKPAMHMVTFPRVDVEETAVAIH